MTPSEAIRALCAAWERGDPQALADLFDDDGTYEDPLKEGPLVGREQIREGNRPAMAAIEDCRVEIRHLVADGAVAMAEGYFSSRLADGSGRLDFSFAITAEMKGNRVLRAAEFYDTRPLLGAGR
jgi:ketosteroid isomerase-like protein